MTTQNRWFEMARPRQSILIAVATCMAGLSSAHATQILDQSYVYANPFYNAGFSDINKGSNPEAGQFFTAGITGTLDQLNVGVYAGQLYSGSTAIGTYNTNFTLTIRNEAGAILGSVLEGTVPSDSTYNSSSPFDYHIDLQSLGIQVVAGQQYSFGISPNTVVSSSDGGNGYAGGDPFIAYNGGIPSSGIVGIASDLDFQTFVTPSEVPLPAAAWLMLSGLAGLGTLARRRLANG